LCEDKISQEAAALAASDPQADPVVKEMAWDPITRIAGGFAFQCKADLTNKKFIDAHGTATLFRGYEVILKGRDPRDAVFISSRACGVCGGVHSTCSAMAQEMAYGCQPPPLGIVVRNLGEAAEMMYDHPLINFNLIGPDYSEVLVKGTNPKLLEEANRTPAEQRDIHGYATIGDIMRGLNPLTGKAYVEGLQISRVAREMASLMLGKYPHPSTILPGGVSTTLSATTFNEYYVRLTKFIDYAKKMITFWDDLVNFFYEQLPDYEKVGSRPHNLNCLGIYDDPEVCDYKYEHANEWGEKRMVTPGLVVNGELKTTKLIEIHLGAEEYVEHSFYEKWDGGKLFVEKDPLGNPVGRFHPWNKVTIPKPGPINYVQKYSWDCTPRWGPDHLTMESGPIARHWVTALAGKVNTPFIKATERSIRMTLPKAAMPEMEFQWKIPKTLNALERGPKARAYHTAYVALVGLTFVLKAFELLRAGKTKTWAEFKIPDRCIGVGFHEAGRGWLSHHLVIEGGKIANYQILTPSTWMASPRDPWGKPGPYEESVMNTPIVEEITAPEAFKGIDVLRTIRSYDPCMPCTVHMYTGNGVVRQEINSCCS
jgi:hydrogenase large subunit